MATYDPLSVGVRYREGRGFSSATCDSPESGRECLGRQQPQHTGGAGSARLADQVQRDRQPLQPGPDI